MIQQSIKLYDEPVSTYQVQTFQDSYCHTPYAHMNDEQKAEWTARIVAARNIAKSTYKVGDKFTLQTGSQVVVTGFVDNNSDVIRARGEPCVIYAVCPTWQNENPVRYALNEILKDSHVPVEPIIDIKSVGDETNEIPC